jgi:hypothetical protein
MANGNHEDPELQPVAAARAFQQGQASQAQASQAGRPSARPAPAIAPADPAQWGAVHTLAYPLIVDGERLERVTIRRLTVGDIAGLLIEDDSEATINLRARALACGLHPAVFAALAAEDGQALAMLTRPFLPRDLVTQEDAAMAAEAGAAEVSESAKA